LDELLVGLMAARDAVDVPPVARPAMLLKVAPDLTMDQKKSIAALALRHGLDGLIVSNTTTDRPDELTPMMHAQAGGLSGRLLKRKANDALFDFYALTEGQLPLIGVGGIENVDDVWDRLAAGATLVQIYTGLIYQGPKMVTRILKNLAERVQAEGFASVSDVTGLAHRRAPTEEVAGAHDAA
jgi:dihydroorotate dehydrogenase